MLGWAGLGWAGNKLVEILPSSAHSAQWGALSDGAPPASPRILISGQYLLRGLCLTVQCLTDDRINNIIFFGPQFLASFVGVCSINVCGWCGVSGDSLAGNCTIYSEQFYTCLSTAVSNLRGTCLSLNCTKQHNAGGGGI